MQGWCECRVGDWYWWAKKFTVRGLLRKLWIVRFDEKMWNPLRMYDSGKVRMILVDGNQAAEIGRT